MKKNVSIIISTYKSENFLDELTHSIIDNNQDIEYEILFGIDNCENTLDHVKKNINLYKNPKIKIFMFDENVGPFVTKNSLIDSVKYENVLFFDSDDIMGKDMLKDFLNSVDQTGYVRFKFYQFKDTKRKQIKYTTQKNVAEGVFGIKKEIFDKYGSFMPWRCGADTEFKLRIEKNGEKPSIINKPSFFRRIHGNNLTVSVKTNGNSTIRMKYRREINNKIKNASWGNPEKVISTFKEIFL